MRQRRELLKAIERSAVNTRTVLPFPATASGHQAAPVCITGMHRSGTSMVASVLAACGVFLGPEEELRRPAPDNLAGYWENSDFVRLNKDLIAEFGGHWSDPPDYPDGWESTT